MARAASTKGTTPKRGKKPTGGSGGPAPASDAPAASVPAAEAEQRGDPDPGPVTDWAAFSDVDAAVDAARGRDPRTHPHGMLVEDAPSFFSCGWYWFSSPADRLAFLKQVEPRVSELDEEGALEAQAAFDRGLGVSATERAGLDLEFDGGSIEWVGALPDLTEGSSKRARKLRGDFRKQGRDDDGAPPGDPITETRLEAFLQFLAST